jgi:adenylate cyclase
MKAKGFVLSALSLLALSIYLFVSAPPLLPETTGEAPGADIPIDRVLATVAAENDAVRALYTEEIVGKGTAAGLRFDERWRDEGLEAGPLPALFLREAATSLNKGSVPLGLFLGSEFPISPSNQFKGKQSEIFARIRRTREPEFFYADDTGQHTAMFPDLAGVPGCVTCHNEHPESPKVDWVQGDVMGATTWTYPKKSVSEAEYLRIIAAVRQSFRTAYGEYLTKVSTFQSPPEVGERWPADGSYLPSEEVFMAEFARRVSHATVDRLLVGDSVPRQGPGAVITGGGMGAGVTIAAAGVGTIRASTTGTTGATGTTGSSTSPLTPAITRSQSNAGPISHLPSTR